MTQRHAVISMDGPDGATVTIDGQRLSGIVGIQFGAVLQELPRLTLDVVLTGAELNTEAAVELPEQTAETLVALGWTPPAGQPFGASGRTTAWRHGCGVLNEGAESGVCGGCRFDVNPVEHPDDIERRYVLVELPNLDRGDDAAPR